MTACTALSLILKRPVLVSFDGPCAYLRLCCVDDSCTVQQPLCSHCTAATLCKEKSFPRVNYTNVKQVHKFVINIHLFVSSVMVAVPTTTTGGALFLHTLHGVAGKQLYLLSPQ